MVTNPVISQTIDASPMEMYGDSAMKVLKSVQELSKEVNIMGSKRLLEFPDQATRNTSLITS